MFEYPGSARAESSAFLSRLHDEEVAEVLENTQARRYLEGELAVIEGGTDNALFLIHTGSFEVILSSEQGPVRVGTLRRGDIFGELSFFDGAPRSADVRALEDSEALILTQAGFDRLRLSNSRLAFMVLMDLARVLSERFRVLDRRLVEGSRHR